jgi:hypothetical protein
MISLDKDLVQPKLKDNNSPSVYLEIYRLNGVCI